MINNMISRHLKKGVTTFDKKFDKKFDRELTLRETELFNMIRPTTFSDIVEEVRRDVDQSAYNARRELRNLRNGIK